MKGIVNVRVSNARISFELRLERNITILSGDSATGKTTLVGMIRDYEEDGRSSGVTVQSHKPCRVLTNADWQYRLASITDSIVFLDEGNSFIKSEAFARTIQGSSNYYVIITRESLYQLPYSVTAILKLKTTTKRKKTFVRAYPQYDNLQNPSGKIEASETVLTEDSNSGYELFSYIAQRSGTQCIRTGKVQCILHIELLHRPADACHCRRCSLWGRAGKSIPPHGAAPEQDYAVFAGIL